jgi:allantoate deiminase
MEPIAIDPALVERYVLDLARHGACAETGVCRAMYTPEWELAQRQVADWCVEAGMRVWRDAIGNQWGRLEGREPGPAVVTGSHIDSQLPGGRYDGALGVIAGILAVRMLRERFGQPRRSIDVVSFCQEEGSRFPGANLWASRVIAGQTDPTELDTLRSYDGYSMREVMASVGLDPDRYREAERDDIAAFIELHIEQGPILEHEGLAVGIVDAITGSRGYTVTITGQSDHAGGCPMDLRRDPMRAAAPIIAGVLQTAHDMGRPAVTTVGRMRVEPNYPVIVPREVTFTVNARHPYLEGGRELFARHEALFQRYKEAHPELEISWSRRADALLARNRRVAEGGGAGTGLPAARAAERRGARLPGHGAALPLGDDLRAEQGWPQPYPGRIHRAGTRGGGDPGAGGGVAPVGVLRDGPHPAAAAAPLS